VVGRALGVAVEHWDTGAADRQGAVDAHLVYPDGRTAALEVTTLGDEASFKSRRKMAADDYRWHFDGLAWWWTAYAAATVHLDELRLRLPDFLRQAEQAGNAHPGWVSPPLSHTPVGSWVNDGSLTLVGHPSPQHAGRVEILPPIGISWVGTGEQPGSWLSGQLAAGDLRDHVSKLVRSGMPELHLFVHLTPWGPPGSVFHAVAFDRERTDLDPVNLGPLTYLWLAPSFDTNLWCFHADRWSLRRDA